MRLGVEQVAVAIGGRRIVHEVSLQAEPGEVVGLIGPNGSGKSTLLRAVYRMLRPAAGFVRLGADDVWQLSARESARRTGVVVQETPSDFEFTVAEMVQMGRTPHKGVLAADTADDAQIVASALARVHMAAFASRQFSTLSGGEKQRVLVARALAQQPRFLVLDEPTNHLDIHSQLEILELVRGLGITTLITLHDLNLAAAYCQRLYMLAQGRIVAAGAPAEVLTPERLREVFLVDAVCGRHPVSGALQLAFTPRRRERAEEA
jgi:iron complex transport system ATP-binding protein